MVAHHLPSKSRVYQNYITAKNLDLEAETNTPSKRTHIDPQYSMPLHSLFLYTLTLTLRLPTSMMSSCDVIACSSVVTSNLIGLDERTGEAILLGFED